MANIVWIVFWVVIFIIVGFFVWFKNCQQNTNQGLQDFIIEKTSGQTEDILWWLSNQAPKAQDASITRSAPEVSQEKKIEKPIQNMWANTPPPDVPDWLKGTVEPQVLSAQVEETQIVPTVETKVEAESKFQID